MMVVLCLAFECLLIVQLKSTSHYSNYTESHSNSQNITFFLLTFDSTPNIYLSVICNTNTHTYTQMKTLTIIERSITISHLQMEEINKKLETVFIYFHATQHNT